MKKKKDSALNNARYFYALSCKYIEKDKNVGYTLYRRAERMMNCLNYWEWNMYKKNKLLNLKKVNRCKDKYCFKDIDIKNIDMFEDLCFGLKRKRLRQGYGELYNVKLEENESDDCIENYLEFKDELPETLIHQYIDDMTEKYRDYKKVSIYKGKS